MPYSKIINYFYINRDDEYKIEITTHNQNSAVIMSHRFDPFIQKLHTMCRKDDIITQQLIAGTISWADVPSDDDDLLELEGWRAYAEVEKRAKSAYHRTVRSQKSSMYRTTVKQVHPKPMERKPYLIMKQEQTKHVLSNGRMTPVKEIIDVVVQPQAEYVEADVEYITTQPVKAPVEALIEAPLEALIEAPLEALIEAPLEVPVEAPMEVQNNVPTRRHSKEKFKKQKQVTPVIYQPSFTQLYVLPLLPYMSIVLICIILSTMKL